MFLYYIRVEYLPSHQAINSPEACRRRLFKYVAPVALLALVVNLPKFFESEVVDERIMMDDVSLQANFF